MNDIQYRQQHHNRYDEHLTNQGSASSDMTGEATMAAMASIEHNDNLAPTPVEAAYPFLDTLGSRLDEFTTSDEGFRAYLEAQLGQYEFPVF